MYTLLRVYIDVMRHHDQKQLWLTAPHHGLSLKAFRTGTAGRDHGGVPLSSLFLMTCSTCFLTQLRPTAQG